jgi:hypothetical protein
MGTVVKGLSGTQDGVEAEETGVNIGSVSCRYFPEFKRKLPNYKGQTTAWAVPDKFSREISLSGEVSGSTGVMAATLTTAITLANDVGTFLAVSAGSNAGGVYMDEVTESQTREGWRSIDMRLSSDPLIT